MIIVDANSAVEIAKAKANHGKMARVDVTPVAGFDGIFTVETEAMPKGGQAGKISRYTTVVLPLNGGYKTTCSCEAGTPTHANQDAKLCKHVYGCLLEQKQIEINALNAKFSAIGL